MRPEIGEIKMPQNKVSRQKREIKMPRKKLLKLICGKAMLQKCIFYVLLSWNISLNQKVFLVFLILLRISGV